jgi:hypothetical protein
MPAMAKSRKTGKASTAKRASKVPAGRANGAKKARAHGKGAAGRASKGASASRKPAPRAMATRRADFGAPVDGFFAKHPPHLRAVLEELRRLVEQAAPEASASIKWGMPFYSIGRTMMCALGAHKSHVNLILSGPPGTYADPDGLLEGEGKTGRHLTLRSLDELPRAAVRGWLRTAVEVARAKA